jgi:hypothetical protein
MRLPGKSHLRMTGHRNPLWPLTGIAGAGLLISLIASSDAGAREAPPPPRPTPAIAAPARVPASGNTACGAGPGLCAGAARGAGPARAAGAARASQWTSPALPSGYQFRELQMNLCDSGLAACYSHGQSVTEAAGVIRDTSPDMVTLNEVCEADVSGQLFDAMSQDWPPGDWVFWVFMPAGDRDTKAPYRCDNASGHLDEYGIGMLGHVPAAGWNGFDAFGGLYPDSYGGYLSQPTDSNEERAWACAYAIGSYFGCTTHLAQESTTVAFNECVYLMSGVIPAIWDNEGARYPSVMGGDLNLRYGLSPNVQGCVPAGWFRKGDDEVQHVMATADYTFDGSELIGMHHTDHGAWLVKLRAP